MIDLRTRKAKQRFQREQQRLSQRFELIQRRELSRFLNGQFILVAREVRNGGDNIFPIVDMGNKRLNKLLGNHYKRVVRLFGKDAFNELNKVKSNVPHETKTEEDEFEGEIFAWLAILVPSKVKILAKTTKNVLRRIIQRGISEGLTPKELAQKIISTGKVTNPVRALAIARTETAYAAGHAQYVAVKATRIPFKREWITAKDERVRKSPFSHVAAQGEIVGMNDKFTKTGEALIEPRDPTGSLENIINCRCVVGFISPAKIIR